MFFLYLDLQSRIPRHTCKTLLNVLNVLSIAEKFFNEPVNRMCSVFNSVSVSFHLSVCISPKFEALIVELNLLRNQFPVLFRNLHYMN